MKKKRFSTEQIVAVLKQAEMGMAVADLIRQIGSRFAVLRFRADLLPLEEAVWRAAI